MLIWKDIYKNKNDDYIEKGTGMRTEDKRVFRPTCNFPFFTRTMFKPLCDQQLPSIKSNRYSGAAQVLRNCGHKAGSLLPPKAGQVSRQALRKM